MDFEIIFSVTGNYSHRAPSAVLGAGSAAGDGGWSIVCNHQSVNMIGKRDLRAPFTFVPAGEHVRHGGYGPLLLKFAQAIQEV